MGVLRSRNSVMSFLIFPFIFPSITTNNLTFPDRKAVTITDKRLQRPVVVINTQKGPKCIDIQRSSL